MGACSTSSHMLIDGSVTGLTGVADSEGRAIPNSRTQQFISVLDLSW